MEPILLYGFPQGSATGLVAALEWLGQPYRLSRVDMLRDMKTDAYARLNGRCETPVLITDAGRVLSETMAIASWLEGRDTAGRISFSADTPDTDLELGESPAGTGAMKGQLPLAEVPASFGRP